MRLITKDLHRAFPELDRFDDERCLRFVAAAQRGRVAAVGRLLLNLVLTGCVAAAIGSIGLLIMWFFWDAGGGASGPAAGGWRFGFGLLVLCLAIVAAGIASLVFRDQLLRKRVANFIFAKGKCPQCRYNLLGVRVPESLRINCPECGLELEVDAALTELAETGVGAGAGAPNGAGTMEPTPAAPSAAASQMPASNARQLHLIRAGEERTLFPKWFTPARRRKITRITLLLVALAVVIPSGVWGWRWYSLHAQAKRAAAMRVGLVGIDKISESLNPPPDGATDAWDSWQRVIDVIQAAEASVLQDFAERRVIETAFANSPQYGSVSTASAAAGGLLRPDYSAFTSRPQIWNQGQDEFSTLNKHFAQRALEKLIESGVKDQLVTLLGAKRAVTNRGVPPPGYPPDPLDVRQTEENVGREVVLHALSQQAHLRSDRSLFMLSLRARLHLIEMRRRDPTFYSHVVAGNSEWSLLEEVEYGLRRQVYPRDWLPDIHEALSSLSEHNSHLGAVIEGDRLFNLDRIRWFFSVNGRDPKILRSTWMFSERRDEIDLLPVGTLEQNLDAVNAFYDALKANMSKAPSVRPTTGYPRPAYAPAGHAVDANPAWYFRDSLQTKRGGTWLLLAVERYMVAHLQPPAALSDLVPEFLERIPVDPFDQAGEFHYRVIRSRGPEKVSYILYSVGADMHDDGGQSSSSGTGGFRPGNSGTDYIFHDPRGQPSNLP